MSKTAAADKWMEAAFTEVDLARTRAQETKGSVLNAGYYFLQARKHFDHGQWGEYLQTFKHRIVERTIRRYCEFTYEALQDARIENPKVTKPEKLLELAKTMVLKSPKPYVALMRDMGQFPLQGQYDSDQYAIKKLKGGGEQLDFPFSFETVIEHLEVIDRAPNAARLSDNALEQLEAHCAHTIDWCKTVRAEREQKKAKTLELLA